MKYHKNLTEEKWHSFSKDVQILNIGAEFSRTKNLLVQKDEVNALNCLNRAFELLDATISDEKWKNGLNELLRFREILAEFYLNKNKNKDKFIKIFRALLNFNKTTSLVRI